jgi:hypothetical protein
MSFAACGSLLVMPTTVVRYQTKPDRADENQRLIEKVFAELAETQPDGLRYTSFRLADGVTFVHVAHVETADGSNPLTQTAAFREFTAAIAERCEIQPVALEAAVVGTYE